VGVDLRIATRDKRLAFDLTEVHLYRKPKLGRNGDEASQ